MLYKDIVFYVFLFGQDYSKNKKKALRYFFCVHLFCDFQFFVGFFVVEYLIFDFFFFR